MVLDQLCILVRDMDVMEAWYERVLGLPSDKESLVHLSFHGQGAVLTLWQDGCAGEGERLCLGITVADVDTECARLEALGIRPEEPPTLRPWGAKNLILRDPEGNRVYLRSFPKA